jgi:hypothetical protein
MAAGGYGWLGRAGVVVGDVVGRNGWFLTSLAAIMLQVSASDAQIPQTTRSLSRALAGQ